MTETIVVLDPSAPREQLKPDWQCRIPECEKPVFGSMVMCTACMILFGPWETLVANPQVEVWEPEDHIVPAPEPMPEPMPEPEKPASRKRTRTPKAKSDAG